MRKSDDEWISDQTATIKIDRIVGVNTDLSGCVWLITDHGGYIHWGLGAEETLTLLGAPPETKESVAL